MKKLGRYLGTIGLMLLLGVVTSCIKDNFTTTSDAGSVNIMVNVGSRMGETDTENKEALPDEDIKTLRLILVQDGKVVLNSKHTFTDNTEELLLEKSIRILGLTQLPTDFYAVVNEESASLVFDGEGYRVNDTFNKENFLSTSLGVSAATFPRADISEMGVPMVGEASVGELSETVPVEIPVCRAVARIDLNINNNTGGILSFARVDFGSFFPDKGYLGGLENKEVTYGPYNFPEESVSIENGKNKGFTYYLYETSAGEGAYTVGLTGADGRMIFDQAPIMIGSEQVTEIPRNTILKINATANSTATTWELLCNVLPWNTNEVEIDFEDHLSYVCEGWDMSSIIETMDDNVVHLDPQKEAVLRFTIQSPNTATWRAQLVGEPEALNAIEFVDGISSGAVHYDEKGSVLPQELKFRIADDYKDSDDAYRVELRVYGAIAGKEYELDLTNTGTNPQQPAEGQEVSRYTLLQQR